MAWIAAYEIKKGEFAWVVPQDQLTRLREVERLALELATSQMKAHDHYAVSPEDKLFSHCCKCETCKLALAVTAKINEGNN